MGKIDSREMDSGLDNFSVFMDIDLVADLMSTYDILKENPTCRIGVRNYSRGQGNIERLHGGISVSVDAMLDDKMPPKSHPVTEEISEGSDSSFPYTNNDRLELHKIDERLKTNEKRKTETENTDSTKDPTLEEDTYMIPTDNRDEEIAALESLLDKEKQTKTESDSDSNSDSSEGENALDTSSNAIKQKQTSKNICRMQFLLSNDSKKRKRSNSNKFEQDVKQKMKKEEKTLDEIGLKSTEEGHSETEVFKDNTVNGAKIY